MRTLKKINIITKVEENIIIITITIKKIIIIIIIEQVMAIKTIITIKKIK